RIVSIKNSGDGISPRGDFFNVLAIQLPRGFICIELHRLFIVDTKWITVIIGPVDAGPAQILSDAAGVAPPVCKTELHTHSLARSFRDHSIEKNKFGFVPFAGLNSKRMIARPISEVRNRLN